MSNVDPFEDLESTDGPTADLDRATRRLPGGTGARRHGEPMVVCEGFRVD